MKPPTPTPLLTLLNGVGERSFDHGFRPRRNEEIGMSDNEFIAGSRLYPLAETIEREESVFPYRSMRRLTCPVCGHENAHLDPPKVHEAGWPGHGDLVEVPVWGECAHTWSVCFGFHKGDVVSFIRVGREVVEGGLLVHDLGDWLASREPTSHQDDGEYTDVPF